jgi:general secretion pathway protein F
MLDAGAALDRGLGVVAEDMQNPRDRAVFEGLRKSVREGRPLSRAVADAGPAFPNMAPAMIAAGESDGRPGAALAKLALTLERAQALQSALVSALVYPAMLVVIALGVISLMLFWVVPQFESLFSDAGDKLPVMTRLVLDVSHGARAYGLWIVLGLALAGFLVARAVRQPAARRSLDRLVLRVPRVGALVSMAESARFVRVLASLVEGGVVLPEALALAGRSLMNTYMADAVASVGRGLRGGGGLTEPLAASGVFPKIALSYLRTGEQTAQLPLMLNRLADTLDREVRVSLDRFLALLTPIMTVAMGAIVATVIASIMTAILGFDNLALSK